MERVPLIILDLTFIFKPRHFLPVDHDFFQEHLHWSYPSTLIAIQGLVDDHIFKRLAVPGHADHFVFVAFIMLVLPEFEHMLLPRSMALLVFLARAARARIIAARLFLFRSGFRRAIAGGDILG